MEKSKINRERVLFTGGSGLLAINWAMAISSRFNVALGIHRNSVVIAGCEHYQIDLESVEKFVSALKIIKPNIVVHTVGLTSVERCEAEPELAFHVNVAIAEVVAKACFQQRIKLVHISSDHIFIGNETFLTESQPLAPVNIYGETKAEAEKLVLTNHPEALVIRTNFFGWGTSYRKSFSDFIIEGLRTGKQLVLFDDVYYTPILIETLATAAHDIVEREIGGVLNIVGDERISKYEFGIKLAYKFGLDCNLIKRGKIGEVFDLVRRPKDMSLSNQKVCKILGRRLGDVDENLNKLLIQEETGVNQEILNL